MAEAKRDQNYVPTLLAVSSVDGTTPVKLWADPTTHRLYVDIPAGGTGITINTTTITGGTTGRLLYDNTGTVGELDTATYPSLTELSYVKGVTSGIQAQINAKGAGTVTGTGTINELSYWTGASSQGTLAVATYPSLTEVSYVKGVTSAIQTQLNARLPLVGGTMTGNISAVNITGMYNTTATSGGTLTLVVGSMQRQFLTGTLAHTVVLPAATTLTVGHTFWIDNNSTQAVTVQTNGGATLWIVGPGTDGMFVCTDISTAAGIWDTNTYAVLAETGKVVSFSNSLTFTGTDGTSMAFPSTSKTIMASDFTNASGAIPSAVTATTQSANDNSTKIATTAYVDSKASGSSFWTLLTGATRVSNTTFTVTGDQTALISKGMIIKWTESSTVRVAMVDRPSTVSGNTTVTIIGDTMASIDASSCKYAMVGAEPYIARFAVAGNIGAVASDVANVYYATEPMRVLGADLQVGTAGTTNSTTIDINKGGTTMFTTKPTLATTVATSPTPFTADTATSLALADRVSIDIDAIQTTNAIDLYVQLYMIPTRLTNLT